MRSDVTTEDNTNVRSSALEVAGRRARAGVASVRFAEDASSAFDLLDRVERARRVLGNNGLAQVLGVSASQPSRWMSGKERPGPGTAVRVTDLSYLLERLLQAMYPDQAEVWLASANGHLGGARPLDVFQRRGVAPVVEAIEAYEAGTAV